MALPNSNPRYAIVKADNTHLLAAAMQSHLADGVWECSGGPFWDADVRKWCQAIQRTRPDQAMPGEIQLREPKRRAV